MGRPKLLLPWGRGKLIDQVLAAWTASSVNQVVVVIRRDDEALYQACAQWPVIVLQPTTDPPDMKASIQLGLRHLAEQFQPADNDRCFIAPADLPCLSSQVIDRLVQSDADTSTTVIPQFGERQGHPILLPWKMTDQVFQLADHEGVDRLVARHNKAFVRFSSRQAIEDVDTPEEYQQALAQATHRMPRGASDKPDA